MSTGERIIEPQGKGNNSCGVRSSTPARVIMTTVQTRRALTQRPYVGYVSRFGLAVRR